MSPADSEIFNVAKIESDEVLLVKNKKYNLCEFLEGKDCKYEDINNLKNNPKNDLYSIIFYLSPGDYHRFHYPVDMKIEKVTHIPGILKGVDKKTL